MTQEEEIQRYKEIYKIRRKKNLDEVERYGLEKQIEWQIRPYSRHEKMRIGSITMLKPFINYDKEIQYEFIKIVHVPYAVESVNGAITTIVLYNKHVLTKANNDHSDVEYKYETRLLSMDKDKMWNKLYLDDATLIYGGFKRMQYNYGKPVDINKIDGKIDQAVMIVLKKTGHNDVTLSQFKRKHIAERAKAIKHFYWHSNLYPNRLKWIVKYYYTLYTDYKKITGAKESAIKEFYTSKDTLNYHVKCLISGELHNSVSLLLLLSFIDKELKKHNPHDFSNDIDIAKGVNKREFLNLLKDIALRTSTSLKEKNGEPTKRKENNQYPFAKYFTHGSPQQIINDINKTL